MTQGVIFFHRFCKNFFDFMHSTVQYSKLIPAHTTKALRGSGIASLYSLKTDTRYRFILFPFSLTSRKEPNYALIRRSCGPQNRLGRFVVVESAYFEICNNPFLPDPCQFVTHRCTLLRIMWLYSFEIIVKWIKHRRPTTRDIHVRVLVLGSFL
jgi:hypothetical protein